MSIELNSNRVTVRSRRRKNLKGIDLRQFRYDDSDFETIANIENANYPDSPISAGEYRFYDETRDKQYLFERFVAGQNGRVLGHATYGQPWWSFAEGKYFFDVRVTENEEDNPMLDLNMQLGFKEKPAFVSYEKKLELVEPEKEFMKVPF